jgi:hypothetical protein
MSVKEFFAFANIKIAVVEFLKQKADFEGLAPRHKKPFRAHINKHSSSESSEDYFASDGFNSIRCVFSETCKENFSKLYPESLKISNTVNMLICIQSYFLQAVGEQLSASGQPLEVQLVIDEMRVISFDRFQMKLPSSVQYDDLVRTHLAFYKHYL